MHTTGSEQVIQIRGAREHNLKDLSLNIPRHKLVVITGPSGSGKSTLAFDTIFAEGQRRYIESLSVYAKQFVDQLKKPEVESIRGLCPSISIQQKGILKNPRSTVGTLTEIYDFLRLLYSRIGSPHCPTCRVPIARQSQSQIVDQILEFPEGTRLNIMATIARQKKGEFTQELDQLVKLGIVRVRIDGEDRSLERGIRLEKQKPHVIEAYVDRLILKADIRGRVGEAVALASAIAKGQIQVELIDKKQNLFFNESQSCPNCGRGFPELTPRLFSFNSPLGSCPKCQGMGFEYDEDSESTKEEADDQASDQRVKYGEVCDLCEGTRLRAEARSVFIDSKSITELSSLALGDLKAFIEGLRFDGKQALIAEKILKEITDRIDFLNQVGLDYLNLERRAATLSGGEEQRVRLATQIGTKLTGVLYVLDEPSIGLHQYDNAKLISALKTLRDMGNSVIVVEHDLDTMESADQIIDLGPGAGRLGGSIVDQNSPDKLKTGATYEFLSGQRKIQIPKERRIPKKDEWIEIKKAALHNLRNIDVNIPLGLFTVITGVSGSGKSTLVLDVLSESLLRREAIGCTSIEGMKKVDKIIRVDQSPIGRSPRSNPATYIGVFSIIRDLFAQTPESRKNGYTPGRFSFNVEGGRCANCKGAGELDIEMHFLADVSVPCEVCEGRRYNSQTLGVLFKGRNIHEVLEMSFGEAFEFFSAVPALQSRLKVMLDVGLDYLKLGQPAITLSGGEAQRVKLAKELARKSTGKTLYILDEPTTGLHFVDIERLLGVVQQLVDLGNTVVMIEHQMDVIKSADYLIDLGPLGGKSGGLIVAQGTPEKLLESPGNSRTAQFLKGALTA